MLRAVWHLKQTNYYLDFDLPFQMICSAAVQQQQAYGGCIQFLNLFSNEG